MGKRALFSVLAGLAAVAALAGCASGPARSLPAGPDWSRGLQVGECSFNDLVALYPEPDGGRVHLAWGRVSPEGDHLRYVQVNERAQITVDRALPLAARSPRLVRMVDDGEGGLALIYLSGVSEKRRIYAAHLDSAGQPVGEPVQVPGPELEPDEYTLLASPEGLEVFWSHNGRGRRGLYHARLSRQGQPLSPSRLLVEGAMSPEGQVDAQGTVHLTWIYEPGAYEEHVYYAAFDPRTATLSTPTKVGSFLLKPKATRYGPVLALAGDLVHVLWSTEYLASIQYFGSGNVAGEGECLYATFARGAPEQAEEQVLLMSPEPRPAYEPAQGAFAYSGLAHVAGPSGEVLFTYTRADFQTGVQWGHVYTPLDPEKGLGSTLVCMPNAAPGQREEAAVALTFRVSTRTQPEERIGVVYLAQGGVKGYQIAGRGGRGVMRPVLAADLGGHLHLAWLEPGGFNRYLVYYASTRAPVREALARINRQDVIDAVYRVAWGLAKVITMFPVGFVWLFVPFAWVMAYYLFKVEGELSRRGPQVALGIAILLYVFGKFFLVPADFLQAAPFVDRVPPAVGDVLIVAVPAAILLVAGGALWLWLRRAESRSLMVGYLVFGVTDAVLTFVLYAPGVLGA